ncbi:ABC transporter substrate-binding protein [Rhodococcus sp. NPDC057297]|uniref:ABC transporter substrate-binding protein n=1 Tax=Rhodococcus sp. NPDC057297 TaxID=3346090 RepID=UPI0036362125
MSFDRRTLLRGVGLSALAIFGAAACSSAVGEQQDAGSSDATPVRGGTLKTAVTQDVVPANFLTNTAGATTVIGLVYESLIRYPHDEVSPTPLLAESWTLADDGLSLTLELRDDVTFHSGRPFTSTDAEFSIRTYADPTWTAQLRSTAAAITAFDTTDPHRLVLTFAHPLGNIFDLLDTVPILDSESIDQLRTGEKFVGTGPFVLTERTPNQSLTFVRNDSYRVPERPYLDRVEVSIIPDAQALTNAIRSGQVQAVTNINYRDAETLANGGAHTTNNLEGAELQIYVGTNVQNPALSDVRLRRAIAFALDRDRIITEVFRGAGYPINVPWPKTSPAYDEDLNATFTLDTDRAKALVAEVGNIPALPLTYQAGNPYYEATAQIVQANLAEIGVTVELDPVESAAFVKQLIGQQFPALWVTFHSWAQYTPSTLTVSAYPFNALKNASRYESPSYQAAADAAWQVADGTGDEAKEKYSAVSLELLESLFLIEIGVTFNQVVTANSVHGLDWTKRSEVLLTDVFLS